MTMSLITLANEGLGGIDGEVLPSIRLTTIMRRVFPGIKSVRHEDLELEETKRALKLAAEPGEVYPVVAERIAREAAIYRDFLLHPRPIGKISLTVKEIDPSSPDFTSPREQYEVHDPSEGKRDPAEGCASVEYRFNRSATKVLEFMVHDAKDAPLFAVARTYSDWLGSREFRLGPNRVFYLNMVEDSPDYVMVHAGFRHLSKRERVSTNRKPVETTRQFPGPVINESNQGSFGVSAPFGSRLAYLFGFQSAVVSLLCCTLFWVVTGRATTRTTAPDPQPPIATPPLTSDNARGVAGIAGGSLAPADNSRSQTGASVRTRLAQRTKRLAQVNVLSISIDDGSCKTTEGRCVELLSTVQKGIQTSLSNLSVPVHTSDQPSGGVEPATLIVSYEASGEDGQIHLTLYDRQGALWRDHGNLIYTEAMEPSTLDTYCEEASTSIIWEIVTAKMQLNPANHTQLPGNDLVTGKDVTKKII